MYPGDWAGRHVHQSLSAVGCGQTLTIFPTCRCGGSSTNGPPGCGAQQTAGMQGMDIRTWALLCGWVMTWMAELVWATDAELELRE